MATKYELLAQAIGEVCLEWSYLETIVHDMALHLAVYRDGAYDGDSVRHPFHVALSHMKLRERIFVVKALAHDVDAPADYYDRLSSLLSKIDNDLTVERNRYVHDLWTIESDHISRFAPGPKVVRPQSRKRELVMGTEVVFADVTEVRRFFDRLREARDSLIDLENELAGLIAQKERLD